MKTMDKEFILALRIHYKILYLNATISPNHLKRKKVWSIGISEITHNSNINLDEINISLI